MSSPEEIPLEKQGAPVVLEADPETAVVEDSAPTDTADEEAPPQPTADEEKGPESNENAAAPTEKPPSEGEAAEGEDAGETAVPSAAAAPAATEETTPGSSLQQQLAALPRNTAAGTSPAEQPPSEMQLVSADPSVEISAATSVKDEAPASLQQQLEALPPAAPTPAVATTATDIPNMDEEATVQVSNQAVIGTGDTMAAEPLLAPTISEEAENELEALPTLEELAEAVEQQRQQQQEETTVATSTTSNAQALKEQRLQKLQKLEGPPGASLKKKEGDDAAITEAASKKEKKKKSKKTGSSDSDDAPPPIAAIQIKTRQDKIQERELLAQKVEEAVAEAMEQAMQEKEEQQQRQQSEGVDAKDDKESYKNKVRQTDGVDLRKPPPPEAFADLSSSSLHDLDPIVPVASQPTGNKEKPSKSSKSSRKTPDPAQLEIALQAALATAEHESKIAGKSSSREERQRDRRERLEGTRKVTSKRGRGFVKDEAEIDLEAPPPATAGRHRRRSSSGQYLELDDDSDDEAEQPRRGGQGSSRSLRSGVSGEHSPGGGVHFDVEDLDQNRDNLLGQRQPSRDPLRSNPWDTGSSDGSSEQSMRKRKMLTRESNKTESTLDMMMDEEEGDGVWSDDSGHFANRGRDGKRSMFALGGGRSGKKRPPKATASNRQLGDLDAELHHQFRKTFDISSDEASVSEAGYGGYTYHQKMYMFANPWFPSICTSIFLVIPTLVVLMMLAFEMSGRMWALSVFAGHLVLSSISGLATLRIYSAGALPSETVFSSNLRISLFVVTCLASIMDILMFLHFYPSYFKQLNEDFFTECDGTTVPEYVGWEKWSRSALILGYMAGSIRLFLGTLYWISLVIGLYKISGRYVQAFPRLGCIVWTMDGITITRRLSLVFFICTSLVSTVCLGWSLYSTVEYFRGWTAIVRQRPGPQCDPLDISECMLPFPSYHYMLPSKTSHSGFTVNMQPDLLPPTNGRKDRISAEFLNNLDGFSTAGPMMFYVVGLKESDEYARKHKNVNGTKLMGSHEVEQSITENSLTLLLDVHAQELVMHTAEIDYMDPQRPLVIISPARPLKHGTHYAVAVFNATNMETGERLSPTFGMKNLMQGTLDAAVEDIEDPITGNVYNMHIKDRRSRYLKRVIPSLENAAPWVSFSDDPDSLQLLFDFPTVSEKAQLRPIRTVRDNVLSIIAGSGWDWEDHVRMTSMEDFDCLEGNTYTARIIDAELDVPWYLNGFGEGKRAAFLDDAAVDHGIPLTMGSSKFRVYIPCSVWAGIVADDTDSSVIPRDIKAVLDYGHGLFSDRDEASEDYIQKMADDSGYIVTAMDWRGMSRYDLPVMFKALVSKPKLFQSIRDNLIQGYACKLALQHFSRRGLWDTNWIAFENNGNLLRPGIEPQSIPYVFYGNSQGGTLGAGYVALSGPTNLIDRAVLGVSGTPLALVMAKLLAFEGYGDFLMLNFQHYRHVRLMIAVIQMAWDSTEGSGFLAEPVTEPYPPILIQAGLGDAAVSVGAMEALARGFEAQVLPDRPRDTFGLTEISSSGASSNSTTRGQVVFSPYLFKEEYNFQRKNQESAFLGDGNNVHECLRRDGNAMKQIKHFVSDGNAVNMCQKDNCRRNRASCYS